MVVVVLALVATLTAGQGIASGQEEVPRATPSGMRFNSPSESPGNAFIWVRSISPCPAKRHPEVLRYVEAWISSPGGTHEAEVTEVTGDVLADGSWEVSLRAPKGPSAGASASFTVGAACIEDDPWKYARNDDPSETYTSRAVAYYEVNPLRVTSTAEDGSEGQKSGFNPDDEIFGPPPPTTTTTTAPPPTTVAPTTTAATPTTAAPVEGASLKGGSWADQKLRAAGARAELAAMGVDVSSMSDSEVLLAAPVASARPASDHGGIPWWSFVAATMLAIGAVIAWGARRTSALDDA